MTIYIHNMRNGMKPQALGITARCDRQTIYGNPYPIDSKHNRDSVCDSYSKYFYKKLKSNNEFKKAVDDLILLGMKADEQGVHLNLSCWCAPERCHCETIKEYIENQIDERS